MIPIVVRFPWGDAMTTATDGRRDARLPPPGGDLLDRRRATARWRAPVASRSSCSCANRTAACLSWSTPSTCPSPVSQHLRILKSAGVVTGERSARGDVPAGRSPPGRDRRRAQPTTRNIRDRNARRSPGCATASARRSSRCSTPSTSSAFAQEFARRTPAPRREHRADDGVPHPAVAIGRRSGRHGAHRHRQSNTDVLPPTTTTIWCARLRIGRRGQRPRSRVWAAEVAQAHGFSGG